MQATSAPTDVTATSAAPSAATSATPPLDPARRALVGDLFALASYLMRTSNVGAFNAIAELDLSFTQIKALCTMDIDESQPSVKGLAEAMKVSLPAMSRAVDGLYERGFVDRYEDPADRRMKRIRLTDAGRRVTATLNEARLIGLQGFLTSLSDEEAWVLAHALELILAERPELAALRPSPTDISQLPSAERERHTDTLQSSPEGEGATATQRGATP
jgi:DNA-binding MarR family transcriptional regulator